MSRPLKSVAKLVSAAAAHSARSTKYRGDPMVTKLVKELTEKQLGEYKLKYPHMNVKKLKKAIREANNSSNFSGGTRRQRKGPCGTRRRQRGTR
jgi:hypothetical protein